MKNQSRNKVDDFIENINKKLWFYCTVNKRFVYPLKNVKFLLR